mmetsp:Transcript_10213/g.30145  ORF Transcript_10213/g.30145 Transcript_10213/m.30145 type:complete len:356 (-) Transcript_10213:121-1188(-)
MHVPQLKLRGREARPELEGAFVGLLCGLDVGRQGRARGRVLVAVAPPVPDHGGEVRVRCVRVVPLLRPRHPSQHERGHRVGGGDPRVERVLDGDGGRGGEGARGHGTGEGARALQVRLRAGMARGGEGRVEGTDLRACEDGEAPARRIRGRGRRGGAAALRVALRRRRGVGCAAVDDALQPRAAQAVVGLVLRGVEHPTHERVARRRRHDGRGDGGVGEAHVFARPEDHHVASLERAVQGLERRHVRVRRHPPEVVEDRVPRNVVLANGGDLLVGTDEPGQLARHQIEGHLLAPDTHLPRRVQRGPGAEVGLEVLGQQLLARPPDHVQRLGDRGRVLGRRGPPRAGLARAGVREE